MIIDFHVHAFPNVISKNREIYFEGEPEFKLLYESPKQKLVGFPEIINMMDDQEVELSVVFGFPWRNYDNCRINNDYVIELVQLHSDRFRGFCCIDPFDSMAANEVERCLDAGLSGVGELAFYTRCIDKECCLVLSPIMDICRQHDVPVMLHTNEEIGHFYAGKTSSTIGQIYEVVKCFPDNKIVLAHWGGGLFFFNLLKREVEQSLQNVYYDIAASPFLYNSQVYKVAKDIIGVSKFIFGTDFPLLAPKRYLYDMDEAGLNDSDIHAICFENASKLLKL